VKSVGEEAYVLSLIGAKLRFLYYKELLDKGYAIQKLCSLDDDSGKQNKNIKKLRQGKYIYHVIVYKGRTKI